MSTRELNTSQTAILAALQAFGSRFQWQGEAIIVEGALVFQVPLSDDPDVTGAFFVVDEDGWNVRVYLTLPKNVSKSQTARASEYVIRTGYGRRFGALDFDLDHGTLRVRMDVDVKEDTLDGSIAQLFDRAISFAREVSPGWQRIAQADSVFLKTSNSDNKSRRQ